MRRSPQTAVEKFDSSLVVVDAKRCDGGIKKFPVGRRVDLAQLFFDGFVGNVEQSEVSLTGIVPSGEKCTGLQFSIGEQECAGKFVNDCFRANLSADNER